MPKKRKKSKKSKKLTSNIHFVRQKYSDINILKRDDDDNFALFKVYPSYPGKETVGPFLYKDGSSRWKLEDKEFKSIIADNDITSYLDGLCTANNTVETQKEEGYVIVNSSDIEGIPPQKKLTDQNITRRILEVSGYVQKQVKADLHRIPCLEGERDALVKSLKLFSGPYTQADFFGGSLPDSFVGQEIIPPATMDDDEDPPNKKQVSIACTNQDGSLFGLNFVYCLEEPAIWSLGVILNADDSSERTQILLANNCSIKSLKPMSEASVSAKSAYSNLENAWKSGSIGQEELEEKLRENILNCITPDPRHRMNDVILSLVKPDGSANIDLLDQLEKHSVVVTGAHRMEEMEYNLSEAFKAYEPQKTFKKNESQRPSVVQIHVQGEQTTDEDTIRTSKDNPSEALTGHESQRSSVVQADIQGKQPTRKGKASKVQVHALLGLCVFFLLAAVVFVILGIIGTLPPVLGIAAGAFLVSGGIQVSLARNDLLKTDLCSSSMEIPPPKLTKVGPENGKSPTSREARIRGRQRHLPPKQEILLSLKDTPNDGSIRF